MNDSFEQMLFIPSTLTLSNGVMLNQSGEIDFGAGNRSRILFLEIQQNNNISFKPEILFFQSQNKDSNIKQRHEYQSQSKFDKATA